MPPTHLPWPATLAGSSATADSPEILSHPPGRRTSWNMAMTFGRIYGTTEKSKRHEILGSPIQSPILPE